MSEDWRTRLIKAIEQDSRSWRRLSSDAGLGPNFVSELVRGKKPPSADSLVKLTQALGVSLTYVFTGAPMTAESEEILRLSATLDEKNQELVLGLLRGLQPPESE